MKWYFASRTRHAATIKQLEKLLKLYGHSIAYNWPDLGMFVPCSQHKDKCSEIAGGICKALSTTDVFVLVSDEAGTDMSEIAAISEYDQKHSTCF